MSVSLIVQSGGSVVNTAAMAQAARDLGLPIVDVSLQFPPTSMLAIVGRPFIYGSVGFLRWAMTQADLKDHISWDEEALSPATWSAKLGDTYLNHDGYECAAIEAPSGWHVRPIRNDKTFAGSTQPVDPPHWNVSAWTAAPQIIDQEVRVFIMGGRMVDASIYRRNDLPYRERCAVPSLPTLPWVPFDDCVMDLALVAGRWRIIEFNSIHTSGLYACDPQVILRSWG